MATDRLSKYAGGSSRTLEEPWDEIILESENFTVVPTMGPIVEGWLLIIPNKSFLSFGHLDSSLSAERKHVQERTYAMVREVYGSVMSFEHGPSTENQKVGCSVDHAHLHVLPAVCDLKNGADNLLDGIAWQKSSGIEDANKYAINNQEYLFYDPPTSDTSWFGTHDDIPSQLFRKVISSYFDDKNRYDWREYPRRETVEKTVRRMDT